MKLVLEIHDNYGDVLTFTAMGSRQVGMKNNTNVSVAAINLHDHDYARLDEKGVLRFEPEVEE